VFEERCEARTGKRGLRFEGLGEVGAAAMLLAV
jgi:hypothetical protein